MISRIFSTIALTACCLFAKDAVTLIFPSMDGFSSPSLSSADKKDLVVDHEKSIISWICFNRQRIDFKKTTSAMLMLNVSRVSAAGLCGIFSLLTPVTAPENKVRQSVLRFDDMPIASLPLDTGYAGQIIPLDITDLLKAKKFNGVVLRSLNRLSAEFCSKEGPLPPALLLMHDSGRRNPVSWFNGREAPDTAAGKPGDYYICTSTGVVFLKSTGRWDSAAVIAIPKRPHQNARQTAVPLRRARIP